MPAELDGEAGEMKAEAQDVSNRLFLPKRLGKPTVGSLELEPRPLTLPGYFFTPRTWATPTLILLPSSGTQDPFTHSPSSECFCLLKDRTGVEKPSHRLLLLVLRSGSLWAEAGRGGDDQVLVFASLIR